MNILVYSIILSFLISSVIGLILIPMLKKLNLGQNIRDTAPSNHKKKSGIPTFGGIIFILSTLITLVFFIDTYTNEIKLLIFSLLSFGFIGLLDDGLKKFRKQNEGLTAFQKFLLLIIASSAFAIYASNNKYIGTSIFIPFINVNLNLGIFYIPFIIFYYLCTTNGVNLTDGLDGLATSVTLLIISFFSLICFGMGYYSLSIFCGCLAGSLLGFLRLNSYPAKIIMGDTGSLALGGVIATLSMILKNPLLILIVGIIYVIETLSVVIQVTSFKLTGKRVFKMAPIHHALELKGYHETKIVSIFSITTVLFCLIAFLSI